MTTGNGQMKLTAVYQSHTQSSGRRTLKAMELQSTTQGYSGTVPNLLDNRVTGPYLGSTEELVVRSSQSSQFYHM